MRRHPILAAAILCAGLSSTPAAPAHAAPEAARFVRLDAFWARVNQRFVWSGSDLAGESELGPMPGWRNTLGVVWRQPSGWTFGFELGLADRGGRVDETTVFRPDGTGRHTNYDCRYLDAGLSIGWRKALGGAFVELSAFPRASFRMEHPWWMGQYPYFPVVAGLDPTLKLGHAFWHVTGRYQWDLTPAWSHDSRPQPEVTHVVVHDSGFSLGLGIELPF